MTDLIQELQETNNQLVLQVQRIARSNDEQQAILSVATDVTREYIEKADKVEEATRYVSLIAQQPEMLTSIEFPPGLTAIANHLFRGTSSLTTIEIPEGVTSIGSYCFSDCGSLEVLRLPSTLDFIGGYAFDGMPTDVDIQVNMTVEQFRYLRNHGDQGSGLRGTIVCLDGTYTI